ncbi:hypothetical protein D3C81_1344820 [compost metagenome]
MRVRQAAGRDEGEVAVLEAEAQRRLDAAFEAGALFDQVVVRLRVARRTAYLARILVAGVGVPRAVGLAVEVLVVHGVELGDDGVPVGVRGTGRVVEAQRESEVDLAWAFLGAATIDIVRRFAEGLLLR